MKVTALETLTCVIQKGSFAAAAQQMKVTPSAVSQQMQQLESHFGQPLFDRSSRTVTPTALAYEIGAVVGDTLKHLDALRERRSPVVSGRIRLGVVNSVQVSTLPACLLLARRRYPQLEIQQVVETSAPLLHQLRAGSLDAVIVVRPETGGSSRLQWTDLQQQRFIMLAPPQTRERSPQRIAATMDWVSYHTGTTGGRIASQYVKRLAPGRRPALEFQATDTIVAMVAAGLGFTVMPQPRVELLRSYGLKEIDLGKQAPTRTVAFACRRGESDNRRIAALLWCVKHAYGQAAPPL
jgi:DNA-binding transcriptional LysR family regulator